MHWLDDNKLKVTDEKKWQRRVEGLPEYAIREGERERRRACLDEKGEDGDGLR